MTKRVWVLLAAVWFFMAGQWYTNTVNADAGHDRKEVYELWRGDPGSPLSVVFKRDCLEHEDLASHIRLIEYNGSVAVYGCERRGF